MKFTQEQLNSLAINTRAYYDYQQERINLDGMIGRKKNGEVKKGIPERDNYLLMPLISRRDECVKMEAGLEKEMAKVIKQHDLWINFLGNIKGVGTMMAAVIITQFDIYKAPMVSNLVSFAGLAPGKDRKVKGKKCSYNQFLRSKLCGVLGGSFLKCKSVPYSGYYYDTKQRLENSDRLVEERLRRVDRVKKKYKGVSTRTVAWKDAYPDHRHKAAIRKMIKMFLKDLYVAWRELEGLPIRVPYEEEYLGRKHAA